MENKTLAEHHIKEIKTTKVRSRYTRTIGRNARLPHHGNGPDSPVRVIITDLGAVGWGLSWVPDDKIPNLIGRSIAELFDPEIGVIADEAMYLDFPLHDLAGIILDIPVYQMIGAKGSISVPCYDGAVYMEDLLPEENPKGISEVICNCQDDYQMGYRDFKIKIGRGFKWMELPKGIQRDIDIVRAVHENFPDCQILVDGNDGYTCDDMIRFMSAVADCNILWIEEPFRENREHLIQLKAFLAERSPNTMIADGEGGWDINFLLEMGKEKLIDVLQMDMAGLGFTEWRKLMPKLIETGVLTSPHTWGDPLKVYYTAQFAAGMGNIPIIEGIPSRTYDADVTLYKLKDGILSVPDAPGFGMRIKNDL
jgi:D-galactarolactone cycloisomerase